MESKRPLSARRQVSEDFRRAVQSGELSPGDALPSTQELARRYATSDSNVHQALTLLVREGLITRWPRHGTVVSQRPRALERVAVYLHSDLGHPASGFSRLLLQFLERELNALGAECLVVTENRELAGLARLRELAELRQIQGVIAPGLNPQELKEFATLGVPFAQCSNIKATNTVRPDVKLLMELAVAAFRSLGCRRVGMIFSCNDGRNMRVPGERERFQFFERLRSGLAAANVELRPEWEILVEEDQELELDEFADFAYGAFNRIWSAPERPDGLLVYTDDLITGVLMAALERRVQIPEELKLVLHRNAELKVLCPVPCIFLETSVAEIAAKLVRQVADQFEGKAIHPLKHGYVLKAHPGGQIRRNLTPED